MKSFSLLIFIFLGTTLLSNGQQGQHKSLKDKGYLIYDEADAVFIPTKEINDSLFMNRYKGDSGFRIGNEDVDLRLKEICKEYQGITNYVIDGMPKPTRKIIRIIPVEIKYEFVKSVFTSEKTDILFRYHDKDYIFNFWFESNRKIISLLPLRRADKKSYRQQLRK